jgi:hypothetical protein
MLKALKTLDKHMADIGIVSKFVLTKPTIYKESGHNNTPLVFYHPIWTGI